MASYVHKINKYFPCFFIFALLVMNFDRYLATSYPGYLPSNIGNERKTFNSSCNTDHRRNNFDRDVAKHLKLGGGGGGVRSILPEI